MSDAQPQSGPEAQTQVDADVPTAEPSTGDGTPLRHILEAALLAADEPLSKARLLSLFPENEQPSTTDIGKALETIAESCADRGVELREVASGFRLQVRGDLQPWVARLWTEKPQKYSRAMLETLALIAYRQPITRGEIESVRGVSLSSNIIRSLQEREWIRIVGHRDVPGKPALFGTTKAFLDYFDLKSLDELPTLAEIRDMETLEPELAFDARPEEARSEAGDDGDEGDDGDDGDDGDEGNDRETGDVGNPETDEAAPPDNSLEDGPVDDEDLDHAFEELDRAFGEAERFDPEEDDEKDGETGGSGEAAPADSAADDDPAAGDDTDPRSP